MMRRLAFLVVAGAAAFAVAGPWIIPSDPNAQQLALRLAGPSWNHPFGLDELGRDILARLAVGARVSLLVGLVVVSVSADGRGPCRRGGRLLGRAGGRRPGAGDGRVTRVSGHAARDRARGGPRSQRRARRAGPRSDWVGRLCATRARAGVEDPRVRLRAGRARVGRAVAPHPRAARAAGDVRGGHGAGDARDGRRGVGRSVALSFLGLGVQPPTPSWGAMLDAGRSHLLDAPHLAIAPGAAIAFMVLSFNLAGDALRDKIDQRL